MKGFKNKLIKNISLISIMGIIYFLIEIAYRQKSSPWMILVGGACSYLVGLLNEHPRFYDKKMWQQCLIGTIMTLIIEFISGMILNVWLQLNIWSYVDEWGNLYGQICPIYSLFWFILMPLAIHTDDWLRWKLFNEDKPTGLLDYYKDLVTGK